MQHQVGSITMAEVARRCRLSKATVSRALSLPADKCPIKSDTRKRIIRVAQEMGYRPNWRARVFSRQKTHTVGLVISGLVPQHEAVPHEILEAFARVLRGKGYHVSLVPTEGAFDWRDLVFGGHVDGCATINDPLDEVVREISKSSLPAVAMNASVKTPLPVVTVDDFGGGQQAGRYLRQLGHRRVAMYVNEDANLHYSQEERLAGLTDGLRGGKENDPEVEIIFVRDEHHRAMSKLLDARPGPTAVVCYSHYEAIPILKEAWDRKIVVPEQLSVIGFNDVFPMECLIPPVTTVAIAAEQIGSYAARLLLKQIQEGKQSEPSAKIFPESLILRSSCAAPRMETI